MKRKQLRLLIETIDQIGAQTCRMEAAQVHVNQLIADRLARMEALLRKHIDTQTSDRLDRGQTASALHGLIKSVGTLDKKLSKETT
jgi:hypothetical protein